MSHDMPDGSAEKKEAPEKLVEVFKWHERTSDVFRAEITADEVKLFNELLNSGLSREEIRVKLIMVIDNELFEEWETAVGQRLEELNRINGEAWRRQAVYHAVLESMRNKSE